MASSPACTALLTEHLRCTPLTIIDDIINTTNELLYHSVAAVETYLLTSAPSSLGFLPPPGTIRDTNSDGTELYSDAETEELEKGIHSLETLLESAVDRSFDRFEIYVLRNILTVPEDLVPWVRLAHHKNLDFKTLPASTATSTTTTPTPPPPPRRQHKKHKRAYARSARHSSHPMRSTRRSAKSGENPFSFVTPTRDAAAFAVSQVDLIRQLVGALRTKYDAFRASQEAQGVKMEVDGEGESGGVGGVVKLTPEEERKRYIEQMTRRHIEASRGLRLNARGEVVGGEFDGAVVRKGLAEVEALEAVFGKK
ncbi:uncharacterized protein LAJ45_03303 [Morchella importuna]|uniref:uncharacterized protein n=1 Tax=Morchella importuna TaxID=1174673 RepID=UPI001E8EABE0|nr:uncharacterized protein LAJ45_03303 [Morchella importuna]KAH8152463.1 hypothetical protein LAJ45_03303 [Morchella importuna]